MMPAANMWWLAEAMTVPRGVAQRCPNKFDDTKLELEPS